ncbi:hypothetical protein HAQ00_02265 [Acidithiobacillus caldus ATCC 51756]|jgi:hypothetical protein|uniref:hypothetical protein n=1 Tax=Acidithiobacillus caldus TaxID=33059 RepID=UPI001C0697E7|nr:hypothetical protein [Acidithiobacillus caldus]MBU2734569.1 hypothetical protein [Acidithiobacillus caldus ATCC 51756]MBU2801314.1 hypothetical protein [Acidithiobacillus caldus]
MVTKKWTAAIAALAFSLLCSASAFAITVTWNGKTYIPLGVRRHAITTLVMPGPIATWWSGAPNRIGVKRVPGTENTLTVWARSRNPSQRLFLRSKNGTIYMADVARHLPYQPIVKVENATTAYQKAFHLTRHMSVEVLMQDMLRGITPPGFYATKVNETIMNTPPYRIVAKALLRSPTLTGVIAVWQKNSLQSQVRFDPETFRMTAPGMGKLRMIAANRWTLGDGQRSAMFLVFSRG